ncbi:MAG: hypothetical protein R2856_02380 [Caldilineaceae bacterium]
MSITAPWSSPCGIGSPSAVSKVETSMLVDTLSVTMALVVTGVGALIHIYATGYMHDEPRFRRFFVYLNFFVFAMLILILSDNFLGMFVGWEGVGWLRTC